MSTKLHTAPQPTHALPLDSDFSCVIVQAEWNALITDALANGAHDYFKEIGLPDDAVKTIKVPGAVELTYGAKRAIDALRPSAVIILGCVIRGDTPHFDYVCESVTQGVTSLNAKGDIPVVFGLLTVENEQQALDRSGGILGNKGYEAAQVAVHMANLALALPPRD